MKFKILGALLLPFLIIGYQDCAEPNLPSLSNLNSSRSASSNSGNGSNPGSGGGVWVPGNPPNTNSAQRVLIDSTTTNWIFADRAATVKWIRPGGDWLDKTQVLNGPTPTVSYTVTSNPIQSVNVSGIDGDLYIQGLKGSWTNIALDGVPAEAFWVDSTSAQSFPAPIRANTSAFVVNRNHAKILTFTAAIGDSARAIRVDQVAGPQVAEIPWLKVPWGNPDIIDLDITSRAAVKAFMHPYGDYQPGNTVAEIAYNEEYLVDPQTGLHYLRFSTSDGPPYNTRLISWFLRFTPRDEVYMGFAVYLESDVDTGMNELGVKLSGLGSDPSPNGYPSFTSEHGEASAINPGLYGLVSYRYDAMGIQANDHTNVVMRPGRWYYIEMHGKMNTTADVSDGVEEMWCNGNLVLSRVGIKIRSANDQQWGHFHGQVYHGGMTPPKGPMHYRIARIGVSSKRVGIPPEFH